MANPRVSLSFGKDDPTTLNVFTGGTITGLTANAALPTPKVTVAKLTTDNNLLGVLISNAMHGSPLDRSLRDDQVQVVLGDLYQNAYYVQLNCQGSETIILSSGYNLVNGIRHHYPMVAPVTGKVTNPGTGRIKIKIEGQSAEIKQLCAEVSTDNGVTWVPAGTTSTKHSITLMALAKGVTYKIRIYALGIGNVRSDYSVVLEHMAT